MECHEELYAYIGLLPLWLRCLVFSVWHHRAVCSRIQSQCDRQRYSRSARSWENIRPQWRCTYSLSLIQWIFLQIIDKLLWENHAGCSTSAYFYLHRHHHLEMILGRIDSTSIPSLSTPAGPIQRVTTFKLLGLHLDAGLSWTTHINTIVSKASKRLYFLKQLRRAGLPPQQLLHFYTAVIHPVLEYAPQSGTIPSPKLSLNN